MPEKCAYETAEQPSCELSALPNKPFCSKHTVKCGTVEEMEQVNHTGLSTKRVLKDMKRDRPAPSPDAEVAALQSAEADDLDEAFTPAPPKRAVANLDPEVYGGQLAELLVQAEMEDRLERFGVTDGGRYKPEGSTKKVPFKFAARRVRPDATCIVDPITGKSPVPPGWCARWVRQKDHYERPTAARVIEFEDYNYQPVKDANGKTITSNLGVAMMAPPQQYALRVKEKAPLGGVTRDSLLESAEQAVKEGNRQVRVKAAQLYVGDEHGSERRIHEASA